MMKQYTFISEPEFIKEVDEMAEKENRSRSQMIDILLRLAVKERNRKKKPNQKVSVSGN